MYSVLLSGEDLMNETQLVRDCIASIGVACDSTTTDALTIQALIRSGDATSDSGLLLQYIIQNTETIKQQLKLIKRRLPQDITITKCGLAQKTITNLRQTVEYLGKAMNVLFMTTKQTLAIVILNTGAFFFLRK